jgi:hypothetical protein
MYTRPWTEEERAVLQENALAGMSANQVAYLLKRSKGSVLGFAHRQFGGYEMISSKPPKPMKEPKPKAPRKDGLSPSGRSTKRLEPEVVQALFPEPPPLLNQPPVEMMSAGRFQCRFIVSNEPKDPNPWMCGAPVKGTSSWCPYHHRIVLVPFSNLKKAKT